MSASGMVDALESHLAGSAPVSVVETTKSWVFLTPDDVLKLKKPVRDNSQDLTSLQARHHNCLSEIDLNRRLAPDLYLGIARVGRHPDGSVLFDCPTAETLDWLVHMRRLPKEQMLDVQIAGGADEAMLSADIDRVAARLTDFYRSAPRSHLTMRELATVKLGQMQISRKVLLNEKFAQFGSRFATVLDRMDTWIAEIEVDPGAEMHAGRVVEGHGDLRPEHVCLTATPSIFDCLEFNRTLRLADPFSEVVFLGMECEMLGAEWIKPRLVSQLATGLGVEIKDNLLRFYEAYHAVVRARLSMAHLLVPKPRKPEKWTPLASRYLSIAERLID